jgi:hypothetical protein
MSEQRQTYRLKDSIQLEAGEEGAVLVDGATGTICALNGTGQLLAEALRIAVQAEDLAGLLVSAFGISRELADGDVESFLQQLSAVGFLELVHERDQQRRVA